MKRSRTVRHRPRPGSDCNAAPLGRQQKRGTRSPPESASSSPVTTPVTPWAVSADREVGLPEAATYRKISETRATASAWLFPPRLRHLMSKLTRLPEPHRSLYRDYKAYSKAVDLAIPSLVEPSLFYDPVHNAFRRTDRRYTTVVKATLTPGFNAPVGGMEPRTTLRSVPRTEPPNAGPIHPPEGLTHRDVILGRPGTQSPRCGPRSRSWGTSALLGR
jgi:hypothetical protein